MTTSYKRNTFVIVFLGINQEDLQRALVESKRLIEDDDGSLQAALALSLKGKRFSFRAKFYETTLECNI